MAGKNVVFPSGKSDSDHETPTSDNWEESGMRISTKSKVMLVVCFFEVFIFGGTSGGWNVFVYVLKRDGVYEDSCPISPGNVSSDTTQSTNFNNNNLNSHGIQDSWLQYFSTYGVSNVGYAGEPCDAQDGHFSLAYAIAVASMGVFCFPIGTVFDKFGLRATRLLLSVLVLAKLGFLGFAGGDQSWFIYLGAPFMSIMNGGVMITSYHICNLLGNKASTCIAVYNGATTASGSIFLFVKLAADAGYGRLYSFSVLAFLLGVYVLSTIFLLPSFKVINPLQLVAADKKAERHKGDRLQCENILDSNGNRVHPETTKLPQNHSTNITEESFKNSALSLLFATHLFWFAVSHLRIHYFVGSFNAWVSSVVEGNTEKVSFYSDMYGYTISSALLISPTVGILIDYIRKYIKAKKLVGKQQTIAALLPICLAICFGLLLSVCTLVETEAAVGAAIILICFSRGMIYPSNSAFLQIGFPYGHFGKLFGLSFLGGGLFNLLQYAFFSWASAIDDFKPAAIVVLVLVALSSVHPINIYIHHRIAIRNKTDPAKEAINGTPVSTISGYSNDGFQTETVVTKF